MFEQATHRLFADIGRFVARRPWQTILATIIVAGALCAGYGRLENESRPDKQWVSQEAIAISNKDFVSKEWPTAQRFNSYIVRCKDGATCNLLEPSILSEIQAVMVNMQNVIVDGSTLKTVKDGIKDSSSADLSSWDKYGTKFSFAGNQTASVFSKCVRRGVRCQERDFISEVFPDGNIPSTLELIQQAVSAYAQGQKITLEGVMSPVPADDNVLSASAFFGSFVLSFDTIVYKGREIDPVSRALEQEILCAMGVSVPTRSSEWDKGINVKSCSLPENSQVEFLPLFTRSLSDEFGQTISADVPLLGSAFILVIIYLIIMLSRPDSVHSMWFMSLVTCICVGVSYIGAMGFAGWAGIKNTQLNLNLPFLLLGLGVDDAFVLAAEFARVTTSNPDMPIEDRISNAASVGGISILITSVTDALAFLVGTTTVLPALSWFCAVAGVGILICFLMQLFFFLPCLALNARRVASNRLDCCCCFYAKTPHDFESPQGCCCCSKPTWKPGVLQRLLSKFARSFTTKSGRLVCFLVAAGLLGSSIAGVCNLYADFELEWFLPDDSSVNIFQKENQEHFSSGIRFAIYTNDQFDIYTDRLSMRKLSQELPKLSTVDSTTVFNWWTAFEASANVDGASSKQEMLGLLYDWLQSPGSLPYRSSVHWTNPECASSNPAARSVCQQSDIYSSRINAAMTWESSTGGRVRYDTMTQLRQFVSDSLGDSKGFPYAREFLYWEEVGTIDTEFVRNVLICAGCIAGLVLILIPRIQVSICAILAISMSVVDTIGFLYWWGVTINGVSTIYILICVGLAVDYSAHIAHMFNVSTGSAVERANAAVSRIGPSVFNACFSTFLAVVVIGFSKSFVFVTFFKCLFLVTLFGGWHGLCFLPALLSVVGGSSHSKEDSVVEDGQAAAEA